MIRPGPGRTWERERLRGGHDLLPRTPLEDLRRVSGIPGRPDLPPPPGGPPPPPAPPGMPPISTAPPPPPPGTRATWRVWEIFVVFILSVLAGGLLYVLFGSFIGGCAGDLAVPLVASEAGYVVAVGLWVKFVDKQPLAALGAPTRPLGDF